MSMITSVKGVTDSVEVDLNSGGGIYSACSLKNGYGCYGSLDYLNHYIHASHERQLESE